MFNSEEKVLWICFHTGKINYIGQTVSLKDIKTYFTNGKKILSPSSTLEPFYFPIALPNYM